MNPNRNGELRGGVAKCSDSRSGRGLSPSRLHHPAAVADVGLEPVTLLLVLLLHLGPAAAPWGHERMMLHWDPDLEGKKRRRGEG
jgi:hypothetical protein